MARWAIIRWIRGLIPAVIILLMLLVGGCYCYLSIFGAPNFLVEKLEEYLADEGFPVKIGELKVSLWPRAVMEAHDVTMADPSLPPEEQLPVAHLKELQMSVNWKQLIDGDFKVEKIKVDNLNIALPVDEQTPDRVAKVVDLCAKVDFSRPGVVNIEQCSTVIQGVDVSINGAFTAHEGNSDEGPLITPENYVNLKKSLNIYLSHLEKVTWDKTRAPKLQVSLSDDLTSDGISFDMVFRAPELNYGAIHIKELFFRGDYVDGVLQVNRFVMIDALSHGLLNFSLQADINKRTVIWDVHSSAPLVSWTMSLMNESLLPREMKLLSEPRVQMNGRAQFDEKWDKPTKLSITGSSSLGGFSLFGEKFRNASAEFSYKDGDFYVKDLNISHENGALTGQVMKLDNQVKLQLASNLPLSAMLNMARAFAPTGGNLPQELQINGHPKLNINGSFSLKNGLAVKSSDDIVDRNLSVTLNVDDVDYRGVEFNSLRADIALIGQTLNLNEILLKHDDGQLKVEGCYPGAELILTLDSNLKPELLLPIVKDYVPVPDGLKMPESAEYHVQCTLSRAKDKSWTPEYIHGRLKAQRLEWNEVPVNTLDLEAQYFQGQVSVHQCRIEVDGGGECELMAEGIIGGQVALLGRSDIHPKLLDQMIGITEDDVVFSRFAFNDKSTAQFHIQGTLGLYNLNKAYDLDMSLVLDDVVCSGVDVKHARTDAHLMTNRLVLSDVEISTINDKYKSANKLSGPAISTLKADSITFDFDRMTLKLDGLNGKAYPAYTMRLFHMPTANVLSDFVFTNPVTLTGYGLFPLGDDSSMSKGYIKFDGSAGNCRYKMLGTTVMLGEPTGAIIITPEWVIVDKLKGTIWEGTYEGRVSAQISGKALNGSFVLQGQNLTAIGKSYGKTMEKAAVHGAIEFTSKSGKLNTIQARGEAALINGNLVEIPIFGFLNEALLNYIPGLGHLINYKIDRADCDFTIDKGYIKTSNFSAKGSNMALDGGGWIRMSDLMVNSDFRLGLRGLPGIITSPVFLLAGGLFQVSGEGPLDNVRWSFAPFSDLTPPVPPTPEEQKKRSKQRKE